MTMLSVAIDWAKEIFALVIIWHNTKTAHCIVLQQYNSATMDWEV
jgi:hypothetical protein